ncbi:MULTISPECIES: hypothetical protein [Hyphomicrobiales]|jgi:hypothetical protein|uniref:hypothetical protein n=1 Tax=Methylobacterium sp. CCH7-A2 TaxID=1768789 RepID=UPI00082DD462|nr:MULTISPECIES: hypothetical protein [Hyphomicrobiales]
MSPVIPFPRRPPADPQEVASGLAALDQAVSQLRAQRRLQRDARARVEEVVARMIELLDDLDGDPDAEDGDERDSSWPETAGRGWVAGGAQHEDAEDDDPAHPSQDDNGIGDQDGRWEQCEL